MGDKVHAGVDYKGEEFLTDNERNYSLITEVIFLFINILENVNSRWRI